MSATKVSIKNIWMLAREYAGLAGAGGVKDVVKQLSCSLARWSGRRVNVVLPLYGFIDPEAAGFAPLMDPLNPGIQATYDIDMNYSHEERRERIWVWHAKVDKVMIYLLAADRFLEKDNVYTYTEEEAEGDPWKKHGEGHYDFFAMNILLQKGAIELMLFLGEKPDVIHCHDAHTAVLPAMINENSWLRSYFRETGTIVTIHNAGKGYHQEIFDLPFAQAMTGLPLAVISKSLLGSNFDPFVAAGHYAVLNTVSENYGQELQKTLNDQLTGWLGHHLLDMGVTLDGVTNGIDPKEFDPRDAEKTGIYASYDVYHDEILTGKKSCKEDLFEQIQSGVQYDGIEQIGKLNVNLEQPLFTFVGRLSEQKGVDVLTSALESIFETDLDFQMVLLGSGGAKEESNLIRMTEEKRIEGKLCFLRGFNSSLANRVYSAGDFLVIPSRYEPCGLTDYIAQLFGNLPIVHHVGGLVKVVDGKTGFPYKENSAAALVAAMERARSTFNDPLTIREMQRQSVELIQKKYTWQKVMKLYVELYKKGKALRLGTE